MVSLLMADTHDYQTKTVEAINLDSTMVLVGLSGGLSAVYDSYASDLMQGFQVIETEHGSLYLGTDEKVEVLDV